MNSKTDRLNNAIENIKMCIKYYAKHLEKDYQTNKIEKNEYIRLIRNLNDVYKILIDKEFIEPYKNKKLDKIRSLNLTIMNLYEGEDYNNIFNEISKTNNILCKESKDRDRKKLNELKKAINKLPNDYQTRISKTEYNPNEGLKYNKKIDNIKFLFENYLNLKYNFKKVKSEEIDYNEMSKEEIILEYLEQMQELCDEKEFINIKEQIEKTIEKYSIENKEQINNNNDIKKVLHFSQK